MAFAVIADFPLGTYRGGRKDGRPDTLPSPARLHAAFLNAAAQGPRAEADGEHLTPCASDRTALEWAEANPPTALRIPPLTVNPTGSIAFRKTGLLFKGAERGALAKDVGWSTALGGAMAWIWDPEPPPAIREALASLCGDVPYLGTSESPVVLRVGEIDATHRLQHDARLLSGGGHEFEVPLAGRTAALEHAYHESVGGKPSPRQDDVRSDESEAMPPAERARLTLMRYVPTKSAAGQGADARAGAELFPPWKVAVVLHIGQVVPPAWRVAWCVALHRALIGLIGDGAPPLVTGKYPDGQLAPANRLAIQYVDRDLPVAFPLDGQAAFVLLVPDDAGTADLEVLGAAIGRLRVLRIDREREVTLRVDETLVPADSFWLAPAPGYLRLWEIVPAAIPESRPLRGQPWTLGDAALLSVGLTWRDRFNVPGKGPDRYAGLAAEATRRGAVVLEANRLHVDNAQRYIHRVQDGTVIQPYRALLFLRGILGQRTVAAIGQTRHLGGGLLVPRDVAMDANEGVTASGLEGRAAWS